MSITKHLVQINSKYNSVLRKELFPVNIDFLIHNPHYFSMIRNIVSNMLSIFTNCTFKDYPKLQGLSGANVGIPFNIVMIKINEKPLVMLNPEIISRSRRTKIVESNCGSINLDKRIKVERYEWVKVKFYKFDFIKLENICDKADYFRPIVEKFKSGTVQHEIDHNKGILITDGTKSR